MYFDSVQRHFTMATYKATELGQLQVSLNAVSQKCRRKRIKADKLKSEIQKLKDKDQLSQVDRLKFNRKADELKATLAEHASLEEEVKCLKTMKDDKKSKAKEIFNVEASKEDDDAFLANLYGTQEVGGDNAENVVQFHNM